MTRLPSEFLASVVEHPVGRRSALALGAAWASLLAADATRPGQRWRVVYLGSDADAKDRSFVATREALARLGALRGMQVGLEHRWIRVLKTQAQMEEQVVGVIDQGWDALIAPTGNTALAAARYRQRAPGPTPSVLFASFSDPVRMGIVPSMERPGGTVTGVALTDNWHAKRLELLRAAFRPSRSVGVLLDRDWTSMGSFEKEIAKPAVAAGFTPVRFDADSIDELDQVMRSGEAARMDAWYIVDSYISWLAEAQIIGHLRRLERPAIHTTVREVADGGALMAYAVDRTFVFDTLADLTLRVLRGEDPGSIPIQRPRRFVLAVRPRLEPAALRIHPSIIRRADRVY